MIIKLKRCPFCGAKPKVFIPGSKSAHPEYTRKSNRVGIFDIRCSFKGCRVRTKWYTKLKYAADAWNRRDRFEDAERIEDVFVAEYNNQEGIK